MIHFDNEIFKVRNKLKPKQGRILISEPLSQDLYFRRSIVLLTEHNDEGSVGFILNKPSQLQIHEVVSELKEMRAKVSIGGPVATESLHYIHTLGELIPDSVMLMPGLYWGGDFNKLLELSQLSVIDVKKIRFFIGYSGWEPGQLEKEISDNYWIVSELDTKTIMFAKPEVFYKKVLGKMGEELKIWANFPDDPGLN